MLESRLGISPVSVEVIDCVIRYADEHRVPLMLIASRNQVECAELGSGYVNGFTSRQFVEHVRSRGSQHVMICRDHAGPFMRTGEEGLEQGEAMRRAAHSLRQDVEAGFDLLHLDCGRYRGDPREAISSLIDVVKRQAHASGTQPLFEVGTEDNVGTSTDLDKFAADLQYVLRQARPEFVVGQTGSLVKELFQVGHFAYRETVALVELAHAHGVKFKEHNADYSDGADLELRNAAGVDAINIGPELGVTQTRTVVGLAQRHGIIDELESFLRCSLRSRRWRRWLYGQPSDAAKAVIAGHYNFDTGEYRALVAALRKRIEIDKAIAERITQRIHHYATNFGVVPRAER